MNNTQLPAEVVQKIHNDTNLLYDQLDSAARDVDSYDFGLPMYDRQTEPIRNLLTEYATKLHQAEQEIAELLERCKQVTAACAILESALTYLPGTSLIHNKIQTFLDGTR